MKERIIIGNLKRYNNVYSFIPTQNYNINFKPFWTILMFKEFWSIDMKFYPTAKASEMYNNIFQKYWISLTNTDNTLK